MMVRETFAISPYISGAIIAVITAMVILGGVKSIAAVCEKLVPFYEEVENEQKCFDFYPNTTSELYLRELIYELKRTI
jgi:hypothetical protein